MPELQVLKGPGEGKVIPLAVERFVLGRNPNCTLVIPISSVSREHALIVCSGSEYFIEDRHSRNGTFVNNRLIDKPWRLRNNDRIRLCDFIASFLNPSVNPEDLVEPAEPDLFGPVVMTFRPSMTEAQWLACDDPEAMLAGLGARVSDRKLRLFACACCRRIWPLLSSPPAQAAMEASERYADGLVSLQELREVAVGRWATPEAIAGFSQGQVLQALQVAASVSREHPLTPGFLRHLRQVDNDVREQMSLLRDLLGNPFQSVSIDPVWLAREDGAARKLAQVIYQTRSFHLLPILADALEEACCTDATILGHLRGPGPHVPGCWAVDALLARK